MICLPEPVVTSDVWPWSADTDVPSYSAGYDWPKISVITPSYNQGKYIEETIRSVLAQNYPNLEYIIIDGGSTDETLDIIKKYEPWISYWVSENDKGQSHAINKGLEKCTGEIFNWLNSDDWYLPDTFYEVATHFLKNPLIEVISGFENHITENGSIEISKGTFLANTLEESIEWCQMAQPSTFFRTRNFKQIEPVPEDIHYIMDGELWVRYLLLNGQKKILKIYKPLVNFRLHENSKTVSNSLMNNFLFERSSIIIDLQKFVNLPEKIINFWASEIYKTPKLYDLSRKWKINSRHTTPRKIRLYYIKKYIIIQFQDKKICEASWGINQLLRNYCFDSFFLRSVIKLLVKKLKI
jgi:glycosyltransferase involved in cell wall biosynthesis